MLAEQGFKTLYLDLDEEFASIEAVFEYGFEDLGIDTMLKDIEAGNYPNLITAINSPTKAMNGLDKKDSSYRIWSKMPPKLELSCFSMDALYRKKNKDYDVNLLKELNMFLLMNMNYDMIILDAPSNVYNELTKISLVYSNRILFTITQDEADKEGFMRFIRQVAAFKINYKEKTNFICNKYIAHTENDVSAVRNSITNYLGIENFKIITVPNVSADVINASASVMPLLWKSKDKNFKKSIQDIVNLILS